MKINEQIDIQWMHPLVRQWFVAKFAAATEPQKQGWPSILLGNTTLISAPTGSGKTFAAFLVCIDRLVRKALDGTLLDETEILYISPLKALGNDIQKNLMSPLTEISSLAAEQGLNLTAIDVAVRTGDTPSHERQKMLKKPPHILITTPESLYLLLTAEKSREMLTSVNTLIVDEIHAIANSKRGSHLALSMERLEALTLVSPTRIGLSATLKPMDQVAHFLTGNPAAKTSLINIGHAKSLELAVEIPRSELAAVTSNQQWEEIYDRIAQLTSENRSTLIFANTRRVAERTAHHLAERLGKDQVLAHHGSLARKLRLAAEVKLKNGKIKALVATASLELGIDIGTVDLVCQLGSPRSISVMLQRIGRAGHWQGAISKGRIFATTRDELLESAALIYAIQNGDLDQLMIPKEPLDVLAQQMVAACVTQDWSEKALFKLVKKAYPYNHLSKETFNAVLTILSEGISTSRGRYGAYLFRDQVNGLVKARRNARLVAIMNGGAIPDAALFTVIAQPENLTIGTLDEDFAIDSHRGDIILLGSTSWKINQIESTKGRIFVENAHGASPTVPFWLGEAPGRTDELSLNLSLLRETLDQQLQDESESSKEKARNWLKNQCKVDDYGAEQIISYILQGRTLLGSMPSLNTIVAERFFDESGGMQLIIHSPFGARINKAWGLALRKCFCRSFNFELQAAATDNGINIALTELHSFPLMDVFNFLNVKTVTKVLTQAVLQSPLFITRWRWVLSRSLAMVRFRNGRKIPPNILRMISEDLLSFVFPDVIACQDNLAGRDMEIPDHPLVEEAIKEALTEALDLEGLCSVLRKIQSKEIHCIAIDTPTPSVFAHEILNANPYAFLDDAPLEERRARAVQMRQLLPEKLKELGKLDPEVIANVQEQNRPDLRSADELHDLLQTLIALPKTSDWEHYLNELLLTGRAGVALCQNKEFWFAVEKSKTFVNLYPQAILQTKLSEIEQSPQSYEEGIVTLLRSWIYYLSPTTSKSLAEFLDLPLTDINQALLRLEASGLILRGNYSPLNQEEWCERRILARIHRQTLEKLRNEIKPISCQQFVKWLLKWQHLAPGTQLSGEHGLLEIIKQLQGYEIPAKAWEPEIFAKRLKLYDPSFLDQLCLTGLIGWGRFSSLPKNENRRSVTPTSISPISFYLRENAEWLSEVSHKKLIPDLGHVAQAIYDYLLQNGASFYTDIVAGVAYLKTEVALGLWELVAAGLTTADSFDNLRSLIDPHRRLRKKRYRSSRQHLPINGRWSLIKIIPSTQTEKNREAMCWILLQRYGVVFRELLAREKIILSWRELLPAFQRLEDRGEIRGGRFVNGFMGQQFALIEALSSLRATQFEVNKESIAIAAIDPLNISGILSGEPSRVVSGGEICIPPRTSS